MPSSSLPAEISVRKETSKIINSYGIWGMGVCGLITLFFLF